jgi:non-specific serine/threonine protein kinase
LAHANSTAGTLAWLRAEWQAARDYHEVALGLYRELNDQRGIAFSLNAIGAQALDSGDMEEAHRYFDESQAAYAQSDDTWGAGLMLTNQGLIRVFSNQLDAAAPYLERALAGWAETGDIYLQSVGLHNLGELARFQRDYDKAARLLSEAIRLGEEANSRQTIVVSQTVLGQIAIAQRQIDQAETLFHLALGNAYRNHYTTAVLDILEGLAIIRVMRAQCIDAALLMGHTDTLRTSVEQPRLLPDEATYQRALSRVRKTLNEAEFTDAWERGVRMSLGEAVEFAHGRSSLATVDEDVLGDASAPVEKDVASRAYTTLSRREREVAALVAQGLTNQEIADELTVVLKTVEKHVSNILAKLGFRNRAEIATWAVAAGLSEPAQDMNSLLDLD